MRLRLHFVIPALLGAALPVFAVAADLNGQGFLEYKKGNHQKALALFEKARRENPKNAFAWFNWARTTAVLNAKVEPDPCEREADWRLLALASIEKALALDAAKITEKIEENEPGLAPLEATAPFKKWWAAHRPLPATDAALRSFLESNGDWYRTEESMLVSLDLAKDGKVTETRALGGGEPAPAGTWAVKGGRLVWTDAQKKPRTFTLKKTQDCFDEGKSCIAALQLEDGDGQFWWMGMPEGDCE